jgi:hypothetical protein
MPIGGISGEYDMEFAADRPLPHDRLPIHVSPPLVPGPNAGATPAEPDITQMVARIRARRPKSGSQALKELRAAFPDAPLSLRVAALDMLLRRRGGIGGPKP